MNPYKAFDQGFLVHSIGAFDWCLWLVALDTNMYQTVSGPIEQLKKKKNVYIDMYQVQIEKKKEKKRIYIVWASNNTFNNTSQLYNIKYYK